MVAVGDRDRGSRGKGDELGGGAGWCRGRLARLVARLGLALERAFGVDAQQVSAGRIGYTKSAAEAIDWVEARTDDADLAILLEPTPVASVAAVARDGDVMPQKSTYFYLKALSGLLVNPLEW